MKLIEIANSTRLRLWFLAGAYVCLISVRLFVQAFGFSLGYLYLILICLAGFWFGLKGGFIAATAASAIFLAEITLFKDWPLRDIVAATAHIRIIFFYLGGATLALLADAERKFRGSRLRQYLTAKKKKIFTGQPLSTKDKFLDLTSSDRFRIWFLIIGFICLIIARILSHAFGFSLGYLYLTLICLAGFWFGMPGGLWAAAVSSLIFIVEVSIFRDWPLRDVVAKSMYLRIAFFFTGGMAMSYLSEMDRKLRDKLKELARYDELTECVNYRWIMEILANEITRCRRYHKEMAVIMIDIDHFKEVNDRYGHVTGNKVLKAFAETVKANVRSIDIVGRYGGEEFLVVLPEANHRQALTVLERVKNKVMDLRFSFMGAEDGVRPTLHFSAGIASFPLNGKGMEELINIADRALYQAKAGGRNRIVVERRRIIRIRPFSSLKVELENPAAREKIAVIDVVNISESGMLAAVGKDTDASELLCRIHMPQRTSPPEIKCMVIHKERSDKDLYLMGLSFLNASAETKADIAGLTKF